MHFPAVLQIAYVSKAATPPDPATVDAIIASAHRNNVRDGVTGMLLVGGNRYLQLIEGPVGAVEALFDKIRSDERHSRIDTLLCRAINERCFAGSPMHYRSERRLAKLDRSALLALLSSQIEDAHLRRQIRGFAHLFSDRRVDTALWPAPDTSAPLFG